MTGNDSRAPSKLMSVPDCSTDNLIALAKARFNNWHRSLREERDRRLRDLHNIGLGPGGRAFHRFQIYEELLSREVIESIEIYKKVSDEHGDVEMLSKSRLDRFREEIMTGIGIACTVLKEHNETDFRRVGEPGPLPQPGRYDSLKGRVLDIVNAELKVLETEGRIRTHTAAAHPATDDSPRQAPKKLSINGGIKFPRRAEWLHERLIERAWNKHEVHRYGGPDPDTVQKILDGFKVREDVLERLAKALSQKHGTVGLLEIPRD